MARGLSFAVGWFVVFRRSAGALGLEVKREGAQLGLDLAVVAVAAIAATRLLLLNVASRPWPRASWRTPRSPAAWRWRRSWRCAST